jgi:DNA mismatch repair protein MutH
MTTASPRPQQAPPACLAELTARADALSGRCLAELERELASESRGPMTHRKGKTGQLIERALGASAGSLSQPDFVHLGVELKTVPVDAFGKPRESTFVCTLPLQDVEAAEWSSSSVRRKLAHVLFVPIIKDKRVREGRPTLGSPLFWRPSPAQEAILRGDFDDLVGMIALGHIEALTARLGSWLQVRPKAAHGGVRTRAYAADYEPVETIPRGFYLRARVTGALLRDPGSLASADEPG